MEREAREVVARALARHTEGTDARAEAYRPDAEAVLAALADAGVVLIDAGRWERVRTVAYLARECAAEPPGLPVAFSAERPMTRALGAIEPGDLDPIPAERDMQKMHNTGPGG
jgi:hypothetical protein